MEQSFSTSKVTVEYFDPHGLYDLLAPGLAARLPLRHLHWQSHSGPLRSIDTLHVELVPAGAHASAAAPAAADADHGFQVAPTRHQQPSTDSVVPVPPPGPTKERRHQIPGLRRTPYLKVLLVRCDDNDSYKAHTRAEIREWLKTHTAHGKKATAAAENHDAFEWLLVHVVLPNTAAYAQPRTNRAASAAADGTASDSAPSSTVKSTASRWGKTPSTVLERLRTDFNGSSSSTSTSTSSTSTSGNSSTHSMDRVAQIRLPLQDVPYDRLPTPPATATGPSAGASAQEAQAAWAGLVDQLKTLILASFDVRVAQYEEDIRERDLQRRLPGWNFCTFFILKEGLARGFESVGLVEDALVGYDELSVGLDTVVQEQGQRQKTGDAAPPTGSFLASTDDVRALVLQAVGAAGDDDDVPQNLNNNNNTDNITDNITTTPISPAKKPYRELILANNVSVFDFRCYLFARQVALLLRLGNASATSAAPAVPDSPTNLAMLAEIGRRTLAFIPAVSQVLREDLLHSVAGAVPAVPVAVVDNVVASFAFSVAQQILAQTATKALPIPMDLADPADPATAPTHPARSSSLSVRGGPPTTARGSGAPPPSPGVFPGPGQPKGPETEGGGRFLKLGLEDLAARRADLYMLSRNILADLGKRRGWTSGWADAPFMGGEEEEEQLEDVRLEDGPVEPGPVPEEESPPATATTGADHPLLRAALASATAWDRLYAALTDKALRHYTVAGHAHAVHASLADLAVLQYRRRDWAAAAAFLHEATPFFGETGWRRLELALLAMYVRCLRETTGATDALVARLVKLLAKAAAAERERRQKLAPSTEPADQHDLAGYLPQLLELLEDATADVRIPLASWLGDVAVLGPPVYADGQDRFALTLRLHSFLAEALPVDAVRARLVPTGAPGGPAREIWLTAQAKTTLRPGRNTVELFSNSILPGVYEINQLTIAAGKLLLLHDRDPTTTTTTTTTTPAAADTVLREPHVVLYQHARSLDVRLATARALQLHKNNLLELTLLPGWNDVRHCEVKVRAATGGLRLLVSEARVVGNGTVALQQPVEGGVLRFGAIPPDTAVTVAFPFSIEQDLLDLCVRVEVAYTTAHGTFAFAAAPVVSTALALGVTVQDVFKHDALFCRFSVSTATASPLRVFSGEIVDADDDDAGLFSAQSAGLPTDRAAVAFPKQPVSLLYRIRRRRPQMPTGAASTTLYIQLRYSVLQDEIEARLRASLAAAFQGDSERAGAGAGAGAGPLAPYARLAAACVLRRAQTALAPVALERAALLGELATDFLAGADWAKAFPGLAPGVADQLAAFLSRWQAQHPRLALPEPEADDDEDDRARLPTTIRTILIPVDIPSVTIVHTADIQLQGAPASLVPYGAKDDGHAGPVFSVNQLLPATLHLQWTRLWDTSGAGGGSSARSRPRDLEFSFEVTAAADTWLIGGRRKGHFVIPAPGDDDDDNAIGWASTPANEAAIPLMLIPLREGYLPYPSVEIREVATAAVTATATTEHPNGAEGAEAAHVHHETDYRNLGETVHVVADRQQVTLSLDASGPGGGPLVLKSERTVVEGRVVV